MAVIKNAFTVFRNRFRMAMASEEGMGVVEVILIILVLIGLKILLEHLGLLAL